MRSMSRALPWLVLIAVSARAENTAAHAAREWRLAHEQAILSEFVNLLALPNVATDTANIRRNATALVEALEKRGVRTRLLESTGAPPLVFGGIDTPGATSTVTFYAHYDGQPLDPKEWATPPWQPVTRDGRIYARSAS